MVNNESEKLIDLLMAKSLLTDDKNRSAFMNPEIFLSASESTNNSNKPLQETNDALTVPVPTDQSSYEAARYLQASKNRINETASVNSIFGHRLQPNIYLGEQRNEAQLESLMPLEVVGARASQFNSQPPSASSEQYKMQAKMQQPLSLQGMNANSQLNVYGEKDVKTSFENRALPSALMENLTALAKLDQLSCEQQQPASHMSHNIYQNISNSFLGSEKSTRNLGQGVLQSNMSNNDYQMGANSRNLQRYNNQQSYQQTQSIGSPSTDQPSVLLQLAAMAAASDQQHNFGSSSNFGTRAMSAANSPNYPTTPNQNFASGIMDRYRNMPMGGRGSPSFGQCGTESMAHIQENPKYYRGDSGMGRSVGNMFGDLHRIPPGVQSHNTLRSMESNKSFPGNYTSMANSTPLEAASQASGGYASSANNSMIPPSTTMDLSNSEGSQMQIRCKFGQLGQGRGQFNAPHGFCLGGRDEDIVVADTHNHRIQVFDKNGNFRYMFGNAGKEEGSLWYPRKVVVMKNATGNFVVCDRGCERSRMQIFSPQGHFIRRIAIRFIDIVAGLAVQCWGDGHIVAVDSVTPTIFVLAEDGRLIKYHECSEFMNEPSDIAVFGREYYICDFKGHSVVVINEDGQFIKRIGSERVTCFPNGIDISDAGDVLIGDSHGNQFHVAVYDKDAQLVSQFVCPNVKVSRCCGLKITMEGYIVTLAKNNHHVLVLNTLYVA
jgi:hypothetical protein